MKPSNTANSKVQISINTNWSSTKFTRPGSGNLVYGEDANGYWKDDEKSSSTKAYWFLFVLVAIFACVLAYRSNLF